MDDIKVIIITGPVGVGKTTVSEALSKLYAEKGVKNALIDLDGLRDVSPWSDEDPYYTTLGYENLSAIWENFQKRGVSLVVIPNVTETISEKEKIQQCLPGSSVVLVRLRASIETICNWLRDREKNEESLKWHLNRAIELNDQLEQAKIEDFIVEVDNKTPEEIAKEISDEIK